MNRLAATIKDIKVHGSLSMVKLETTAGMLSSIVIDTPATCHYLKVGTEVKAIFKETEVILCLSADFAISLQNTLEGKVLSLEPGTLLGKVKVATTAGDIVALVNAEGLEKLNLTTGQTVYVMVKTNEIMLAE